MSTTPLLDFWKTCCNIFELDVPDHGIIDLGYDAYADTMYSFSKGSSYAYTDFPRSFGVQRLCVVFSDGTTYYINASRCASTDKEGERHEHEQMDGEAG